MDFNFLSKIAEKFFEIAKDGSIIAIGTFDNDQVFLEEFIKLCLLKNKNFYFVPCTNQQASYLHQLDQNIVSLNDKEIDLAIEFVEQVDQYNNFIKRNTKSFIKDKMIAQSAFTLINVVSKHNVVDNLDKDVYIEISNFAWKRTLLNLQSYGLARIVKHTDGSNFKTEIGHYLVRLTLDNKICIEDFEYSVRNIPGVLETGVFLGLVDTLFVIDEDANEEDQKLVVKKRT